jgi:hypothetical protein
MRISYRIYPTDYVEELNNKGLQGRRRAMAFMSYYHDMEVGDHNAVRFYAKAWSVGKSTAQRWMDEFNSEIEKFDTYRELKRKQHYSSAKKQVGQMGQTERDKAIDKSDGVVVVYDDSVGQMGQTERDKALNKDDVDSACDERLFLDLFNIYNMNSKFPGDKDKAFTEYEKMYNQVSHKELIKSVVFYLYDPKRKGKLNNLANFLKNEVYNNYLPKHIRVLNKGDWMNGTYNQETEIFTTSTGEQHKLLQDKLTSKFSKGEIEFIREGVAA